MTNIQAPILLAIDTPDIEIAKNWISITQEYVSGYKLGLEFFYRHGAEGVAMIKNSYKGDLFLDLKLHDIPNTVGAAVEQLAILSPKFLTVHSSGGTSMIRAAVESAPNVDITAVTILTSLDSAEVRQIGFAAPPLESSVKLAILAKSAGARAIVCSPLEITAIRSAVGPDLSIIVPGIRPADYPADDQARTMTPLHAIEAGATYLVIGRPITRFWAKGADAMAEAVSKIASEMNLA